MLLRLSLSFSNKVKHYIAIALHTIKRQPYGSCQLPITQLQNMIISYNKIQHHALTISHHNMPCKNKLDVLYFVQLKLERQSPASHLCAKHVEGTGLA